MTAYGDWCKTAQQMDTQGWSGTIALRNIDDDYTAETGWGYGKEVRVEGLGCTVGIDLFSSGTDQYIAPAGWAGPDPAWPADAQTAFNDWITALPAPVDGNQINWEMYRVYLTTPGGTVASYHITGRWRDKLWDVPPPGPPLAGIPHPWDWQGPFTELVASYSLWLKDCYLWSRTSQTQPETRNLRDFIDLDIQYQWRGEINATDSGGTVTTPSGSLSSSGAWGSHPGSGPFGSSWGTTCSMTYYIKVDDGAPIGTEYASISPEWDAVPLYLDKLDDRYYSGAWHHKPYPTVGWPPASWEWQAVSGANGIGLVRHDVTAVNGEWTGYSYVPYVLGVNVASGRWSDAGGDWTSPILFDVGGLKDTSGARVYCDIGQSSYYSEAAHSWYSESIMDSAAQANVELSWYGAHGQPAGVEEYSGGVLYTLDDRPAPIYVQDLTATNRTADPFKAATGLLDIAQATVNVHKPAGVSRPSLWVASGGASITTQTDASLAWSVPAGAAAPVVSRTLTTRYWHEMDRLKSRSDDATGRAWNADWPIILKANVDASSVPATDPDLVALTADEDVTNFDNFSYLRLPITHARAGALTVTLTYSRLDFVDDPCYTSHSARFGIDGTWDYGRADGVTATYTCDYAGASISGVGAITWYIDLRCPEEGDLPRGALQHVSAISISGFPVPGSGTDAWSIDGTALSLYSAGNSATVTKAKRSWNWARHFTGYSAAQSGAATLAVQYGYEGDRFEAVERGLKYQQFAQAEGTGSDLTTAKSLARLAQELNWQEGFTATWTAAAYDARYQDADGSYLVAPDDAKWWWLKYSPDTVLPHDVALPVRNVTLERGVKTNLYVRHHLDENAQGLYKDGTGTYRLRSSTADLTVHSRDNDTGATAVVSTVGSDANGRWVSGPLAPDGYGYYVTISGRIGQVELGAGVSREWLSADAHGGDPDPAIIDGPAGHLWLVYCSGSSVWCKQRLGVYVGWEPRHHVAAGSSPTIDMTPDGALRLSYVDGTETKSVYSKDGGRTWQ